MMADAFDLLALAPSFDLDKADIQRAYLAAAALIHPDLAAGDDEAGRKMAALNGAARVLENPELRADLLVRRLGGPSADQERTLPGVFLAEMMSVREEIETSLLGADAAARADSRRTWEDWAGKRRREAIADVSGMFSSLPAEAAARATALRAIRIRLNQWRYIERLIEQLDPGFKPGP
jgi:curved DNA-binding protein CbpA